MCKEVGAYPKCAQCPAFVEPDSTPGVMTWGADTIKGWHKQASALQKHVKLAAVSMKSTMTEQACMAADSKIRAQVQNKLAGICEDMCKEA